jgi:hypothetical protein
MATRDLRTPDVIPDTTASDEHNAVRSSNDRDQAAERAGITTAHNEGYDETVKGAARQRRQGDARDAGDQGDVDPDSARSEIDRDDTVDGDH